MSDLIADPLHDGVGIEWFADEAHLRRFESWLESEDATMVTEALDRAVDVGTSPLVLADEVVMRGGSWLEERWREGSDKIKQMAIARRAAGLTPAQFSQLWKSRAGTIGTGSGQVVAIPEEARGCAYVQNHPRIRPGVEWSYDALNEVYFDDVGQLRLRVEWFEDNMKGQAENDLVSESWFVAAREEVLVGGG